MKVVKVEAAEEQIIEVGQAGDTHDEAGKGGEDPASLLEHVLAIALEPRVGQAVVDGMLYNERRVKDGV